MYGLLDCSWDKYTKFCDSYEAANEESGSSLSTLVKAARNTEISPYMPSAAELSKQAQLSKELWYLLRSYHRCAAQGNNSLSKFSLSKFFAGWSVPVSADLKQHFDLD